MPFKRAATLSTFDSFSLRQQHQHQQPHPSASTAVDASIDPADFRTSFQRTASAGLDQLTMARLRSVGPGTRNRVAQGYRLPGSSPPLEPASAIRPSSHTGGRVFAKTASAPANIFNSTLDAAKRDKTWQRARTERELQPYFETLDQEAPSQASRMANVREEEEEEIRSALSGMDYSENEPRTVNIPTMRPVISSNFGGGDDEDSGDGFDPQLLLSDNNSGLNDLQSTPGTEYLGFSPPSPISSASRAYDDLSGMNQGLARAPPPSIDPSGFPSPFGDEIENGGSLGNAFPPRSFARVQTQAPSSLRNNNSIFGDDIEDTVSQRSSGTRRTFRETQTVPTLGQWGSRAGRGNASSNGENEEDEPWRKFNFSAWAKESDF